MDKTLTAYYKGIEVMIMPENSFLNRNGTPIAAIEKIDDCRPDGLLVPKHVPFDNLSFINGEKCRAVKLMKKILKKRKGRKNKKTIKKPGASH